MKGLQLFRSSEILGCVSYRNRLSMTSDVLEWRRYLGIAWLPI